ncbi:probable cytosolic iron-sulfur protein assembly protein 1 [[Candida] jaroonii]|uniref:Probable cytosolic iron-sulfur protein assembly protein 1 n=1 Tax=[Candida] jaroonii TaxID=467808 RepID=A0ACA9YBN4_9ASCO|nr:probable cytosolic iron-sulfur protein assembly protein 1 [[Candida] jaroonii]
MVKLIKSIQAHKDKAWSVSSHANLPLLATASTDKTSNVYNLSKKKNFPLITKLEDTHKRSIRTVAFKPPLGGEDTPDTEFIDLPALATGSFDSTVSIWGVDEPEEDFDEDDEDEQGKLDKQVQLLTSPQNEWNLMAIIEGHENEIKAVAWNYQGNLLATCSRDKTIWIWETDPETLEEFECISVLSEHDQDIKNVTWHPTQNLLASSSYDDTIRLYKQDEADDDWSSVGVLNGHEGTVWCSSFEHPKSLSASQEKIRIVSCSDDSTVRVWCCKTKKLTEEDYEKSKALPSSIKHSSTMTWEEETVLPKIHEYSVYSVSWSRKTGKIVSGGSDGKIVVYKQSPDSEKWEIESVQELSHGVTEINCVSWCRLDDGEEVIVSAGDDGNINIWEP